MLVVEAVGRATSVQDAGRSGLAALGVPTSGALDTALAAQVNRLVGNPPTAAVVETAGGLVLTTEAALVVATSSELTVRAVPAGARLAVEPLPGELWGYLAVRGGIEVDTVLGSRSLDSRSGLGPAAPTPGQRLPVGADPATPLPAERGAPPRRTNVVRLWPGPRRDWFTTPAQRLLVTAEWRVTPDVSRVGARLDGPPLARAIQRELTSEGLVLGAVQVPTDGRPVVMLADHPTTGGYPVVAVVDPGDLASVVQSPPGATLRFRWVEGVPM